MKAIESYAIIGDGRAAALVSRDGSIDWLCWPRFDSPSVFGSLLGTRGGCWSVRPAGPYTSERHYIEDTNVLVTRFDTATGRLRVTDLMPVMSEEDKGGSLVPEHELVRELTCEDGEVAVDVLFDPRPGYALADVRMREARRLGWRFETREGLSLLRTDIALSPGDGTSLRGRARLRAGESRTMSLTFAHEWPAIAPPLGERTSQVIARSVAWWRQWASRCRYDGPARALVVRSALALKLLAYAPSGAIVAAATTSLPERIGGDMNWDYRYCWLRDASLTARAFFGLGYRDEGEAFVNWLLHSTRLTRSRLRILYDVFGCAPPEECELSQFEGYGGSRPVRLGNAAREQLQLDVYGEVIEAVAHYVGAGGRVESDAAHLLRRFGDIVAERWSEPDEGIWEPRSGRAHHTHSRLLSWVALDRLLELHEQGHLRGIPAGRYAEEREKIRADIESRAWNEELASYVGELDGDDVDASVLLMAWYGFEDAGSARLRQTYARIRERLGAGNGLLYRNRDRDTEGEGAFGITSFWGVEYLALGGGSAREAQEAFEGLLRYANDVGLYAEEIDPATGAALGNFPQAFTHVGLINAALTLKRRLKGEAAR